MLDDAPDEQLHEETVPAIERKQALVGFTSFEKAYALMQQTDQPWLDVADEEAQQAELRERHEAAVEAVDPLEHSIHDPELQPLPDDEAIQEHVEAFVETPAFQRVFQNVPDDEWEIALVPVDKLTAYQGSVTTTAYEEASTWEADPLATLEYALPIDRFQAHFHRTFKNDRGVGIEFTNRSPNVDISGLQVVEGQTAMDKRVVIGLRAKSNFLWVTRYNGQLILKDGYHRTYRQFANGATHVPAVVQDIAQYEETGHSESGLFDRETVCAERPPTIPDFESAAAMTVQTPATNKVISITAEETQVVR